MRFRMLGMEAHLYDLLDISDRILAFNALFPAVETVNFYFHKLNLREDVRDRLPASVALSYSQRFIHYLRHAEACRFLTSVSHSMVRAGAAAYRSFLGDGIKHWCWRAEL